MSPTALNLLETEWPALARGHRAAMTLQSWAAVDNRLAGHGDFHSLERFANSSRGAVADRVLAALARRAPSDPLAARVLLQLLLPGCKTLAQRDGWLFESPEEAAAAIVATVWTRIRYYPYDRRPAHIAANVLLDAARDLRRSVRRQSKSDGLLGDQKHVEPSSSSEALELVIEAVRNEAIAADDATLIVAHRITERSAADFAEAHQRHAGTLRRWRQKAEIKLAHFALDEDD